MRLSRVLLGRSPYPHRHHVAKSSAVPRPVGEFLYGHHPCIAALTASRRVIHRIFVQRGIDEDDVSRIESLRQSLPSAEMEWSDRHTMNLMSEQRPHNGVIIDAEPLSLDTITAMPVSEAPRLSLLLDSVHDPVNLGSMLRSSLFLGVNTAIVAQRNCCAITPVAVKSSAGASELLDIRAIKHSTTRFIREARAANPSLHVVGLTMDQRAVNLRELSPMSQSKRSMMLVVGNEGAGLRPLVRDECETLALIESKIGDARGRRLLDSLNVSQALSIVLYHCTQ